MSLESERRVLTAVLLHAQADLLPAVAARVGLPPNEFRALCADAGFSLLEADIPAASAPALLLPLIELLWSHRSGDGPWTRLMAGAIASAAFGSRHLWEDLGAAGRPEVSGLMDTHFPSLAALNVRNLKWKNHLFQVLGERLEMPGLRPPRCDGCDEQSICFPSESAELKFRSRHDHPTKEESRKA